MGTKYSSKSISGYNATPPADDGTSVEANRTTWAKHLEKLANPLKTLAEAINTALVAHVNEETVDKGAAFTTTVAEHKKTINVTGAFTQSLGDAGTMGTSYIVTIKNSHTAAITVDLDTGADTLDGSAGGSVSLAAGDAITFLTNAAANGYYKKSTLVAAVDDLISFGDHSLLKTETVTTSGTTHDYTSVPSWVKKITIIFDGVSTDGNEEIIVQVGDSGGFHTSSYTGSASQLSSVVTSATETGGFALSKDSVSTGSYSGIATICKLTSAGTIWVWASITQFGNSIDLGVGRVTLDTILTQIRLTSTGTPDTFDAGTFNVLYE